MKKVFSSLLLLILTSSISVYADEIVPDYTNPVVGLLGASSVDPETSPFNTIGLTALNGSSFRGLADYMKARSIYQAKGIVYREVAEAGATTNGQNGYLSVLEQAQRLVEHTTKWNDGVHLKAAVIFHFNDCLHSIAGLCDEQDVLNNTVTNVRAAVEYLQAANVKVFVTRLIDYDRLDLPLVEEIYSQISPGFKVASEANYNLYKSIYETEMEQLGGVSVIDVWQGMDHIGDGLHADHHSKMRASKRLHRALRRYLRAQ